MREQRLQDFLATDYSRVVGVVAMVCDRAGAEDAVQEAILATWTRNDDPQHYTAWVTAVALNKARTATRRHLAEQRAVARLPHATSPPEPLGPDVARALERLSVRQRQVIVLYYWLDLDVATIARTLGVSSGTVKTQLSRARGALAPLLAFDEVDHG